LEQAKKILLIFSRNQKPSQNSTDVVQVSTAREIFKS